MHCKKRVSIYVNSAGVSPSGYYRILQYFKDKQDITVIHSLLPNSVYKWRHKQNEVLKKLLSPAIFLFICIRTFYFLLYDLCIIRNGVVIISRNIVPRYLPYIHSLLLKQISHNNRIIWDFDDNIIEGSFSRREINLLSNISYKIVVISEFLKSLLDIRCQDKVYLLPTTDGDMCHLDTDELIENRLTTLSGKFVLIWVATAVNLPYLERIIIELDKCAQQLKETRGIYLILKVVCNKSLMSKTNYLIIENIKWSRGTAIEEMSNAHCGIMPLTENRKTLGKGGFKLIQYLSVGLPVIASAVGFNNNVVSCDCGFLISDTENTADWSNAIISISQNTDSYVKMSKAAINRYNSNFSYYRNKEQWYLWCGIK